MIDEILLSVSLLFNKPLDRQFNVKYKNKKVKNIQKKCFLHFLKNL